MTDTSVKKRRRGHNEGAIYQRSSDGRWVGTLSLPNGKRKSFYGETRKEAADRMKQAQRDQENGIDLSAAALTVSMYLERWLRDAVKDSVKAKTYIDYESICRVRVVPRIGDRKLARLTALDLQGLYTELKEAGLSPQSIRKTHRVLHAAFRQAEKWDLLARNPCGRVKAPRAERSEMQAWTPEQAQQFLNATAEHRMHALYVLALSTGMRRGELLGLKWSDVDLKVGTLSVQRALQWQSLDKYQFVTPKTAKSRRTIHLSKKAVDALRAHRDRQAFTRRDTGEFWQDQDLVFCNAMGGPLDPTHQSTVFQQAATAIAEAAKKVEAPAFPVIRFHDMRHTAATILLAKGVHVKLVSEMLGHSTITLTLDTYSHIIPAMHGDAAAAMDAVFSA
ncbi:MAG: tyrosine-type recombinase/integrase [Thermomicrobiales bacterium]